MRKIPPVENSPSPRGTGTRSPFALAVEFSTNERYENRKRQFRICRVTFRSAPGGRRKLGMEFSWGFFATHVPWQELNRTVLVVAQSCVCEIRAHACIRVRGKPRVFEANTHLTLWYLRKASGTWIHIELHVRKKRRRDGGCPRARLLAAWLARGWRVARKGRRTGLEMGNMGFAGCGCTGAFEYAADYDCVHSPTRRDATRRQRFSDSFASGSPWIKREVCFNY